MNNYSEILDKQSRGEDTEPKRSNQVTKRREKIFDKIISQSQGEPEAAYEIALNLLDNNTSRLQEYVLSHGEEPASNTVDLAKQVYELRTREAKEASEVLDYSLDDAIVFLEEQESEFFDDNGYEADHFLGDLWASILLVVGITGTSVDGFIDISKLLTVASGKIDKAAIVRAAKGKKSSIVGNLSSGGKGQYNQLLEFFQNNPKIRENALKGYYTDVSNIPGFIPNPSGGNDNQGGNFVDDAITKMLGEQFKRALPYIIGFVVLIGIIVYFASRNKK